MSSRPPVPALRALRHVSLNTSNYEASLTFYVDLWGLERVDDGTEPGTALFRGTGPEHHILELHDSDSNGIDHIAFAVPDPRDVDEWVEFALREGLPVVREPGQQPGPGGGYGFRLVEPHGRVIEVSANVASVAPRPASQARPYKLAHVVLNAPDVDASVEFWCDYLGFRVSDWSEDQMAFIRTNRDHHNIAFNRAEWASVNHVAYELPSVDLYMQGIGRLKQAGVEPLWGPGRHGPGNNTFAYFADPAGLVPEFTSEVLEIDDEEWLPRVWRRVPDQADLWGTAGPPSAEVRRHMAGTPDDGPYGHHRANKSEDEDRDAPREPSARATA